MNILLIDFDSKIPNLALMKTSSFFKKNGHNVTLKKFSISAFPKKNKKIIEVDAEGFNQVWCSIVFTTNNNLLKIKNCDNVNIGGTGYSLIKELPEEIEQQCPDYSIYPDNDMSYGFITRGCIRNCYFCFVPKKEGKIRKVGNVNDIVKHEKVVFMDNNILGYSKHEEIFKQILDKNIKLTFNQGLDIRLINDSNVELLSKMRYMREYIFAFDDIKSKDIIEEKNKIVRKYIKSEWRTKFYIYCHPKMGAKEIKDRIDWCQTNKALPYIMRDFECYNSSNRDFFTDIASWCNQPGFFKSMPFEEFVNKRNKNKQRVDKTMSLWNGTM